MVSQTEIDPMKTALSLMLALVATTALADPLPYRIAQLLADSQVTVWATATCPQAQSPVPQAPRSGKAHPASGIVLADGAGVGRIFKVHAAPVGTPWMWTLAFGHHEDRTPTLGSAPPREAAMAAFAKSWRRE